MGSPTGQPSQMQQPSQAAFMAANPFMGGGANQFGAMQQAQGNFIIFRWKGSNAFPLGLHL